MGNCASLSSDKQLKETGISSQSYHTDNNDKLSNVNVICHTGHIGIVELRSGKVDPEKIKKEMAEIAATLNIDEPEITDRSVEEFKIKENNDNGGEFLSLKEESYIDSYNPSTGKVHAKIPDSSKQEIDQAVHAAQKAFLKWSKTSVQIRSKIMYKIADLLEARLNEFAEAEVQDQGKTITFATNVDINRSIYNFRYFAGYILHTQEKAHVLDGVSLSYVQRYPIGVAGLISPESGLPDGVVNIVFGSGSNAGQALVSHPKVPLISFTGGTVTGKKVLETSAPFFKKLSLELGGKNPNIIFDDCDFDNAVDTSIKAAFSNQGEKLIVGDPKDSRTQVGALVSKQHMEKVLGYIELAKQEGGVIECGGKRKLMDDGELCGGYFVEPTVITNVKPSCRVAQEEIFGPVVTIHTFESEEEVIEYANDTEYGLSCSVWSGNGKRARRVAEAIQAGTVWVNCWLIRDLGLPFGGVKKSGNTTFALPKFSITSDNNNKRDEIQPLPLGVGTGAQLYDGELPLSCGGPKFIESGGEAYDNNYEYCSQESHSVQCCDDCSEQLSWSNQGENSYMVACRRDPLYMSYCDQSMDDYQGAGCHNNQYAESCDEQNNVLYGDGYQNSLSPELRQQQVSRTSLDEEALAEYVRILYKLDLFVESDYTVVLFTGGAKHKPGWTWMFKAYKSLSRKYKKNLKSLYIVQPATLCMFCSVLKESGLPDGVVNIVFGSGSNAGQALVSHPKVPLISFTGGTVTGKKVLETSAPFFKKLSLELGGKNPNIIFDDCDFDNAVDTSIKAAFSNQGEKLIVGDPKDSRTQVGALVSKQHMEKVLGYIELAKQEGGVIECGGKRKLMDDGELCGGYFVEPTVITNVKPSCRVAQEEIFGPVVTIHTFESEEEVIEYANDTEYGLSCSVWSGNGKRARRVAEAIQAGTVWVNCWLIRDLGLPFGGVKKSGNTTFALPKFSITSDNNNKRDEIQPLPLGVGTGAQLYDGELPLSCGGPKFIESGGEAYDNNYEYCSQESHSVQCCDDCSEQLSWSNQGENSYMVACRRDPLYMSYCDQSMDDYQGAGCHNNQYAESCDEQNNVLYGDGYQNSCNIIQ
ncbi:182_t:CDS:10 [Entrophospora sp. SA101]|nr:182_t:CDS:10 [Entrophospora sp. SA101]